MALLKLLYEHGSDIWGRRGVPRDDRTPLQNACTLPLLHSVLKNLVRSPPSLQQLSRACVRVVVNPRYIFTLPIPDSIKLYLQE